MVDWKKLGGDEGTDVPTGRLGRFASVAGLGASVSASVLGRKLLSAVTFASKEKREAALSRTLEKEGRRIVEVLGRMKGASMKVGQILSADPDLVPPELASALASLQAEAPPMPWQTVREVLERAWDKPLEVVFRSFEPEPRGAASIGQVHRGVLHDGRVVAVKLQYPGVERALEDDLANLGGLLKLSRLVFDKSRVDRWMNEARAQLLAEADYLGEASNLERFYSIFERFEGFVVPRPVPELTTRDVLTMTWLDGVKLDRALIEGPAERRREVCERMARTWVACFFDHQAIHGDPHPGNFLLLPDGRVGVLDFGAVKHLPSTLTDGLLQVFEALWRGDAPAVLQLLTRLGFGDGDAARKVEPALLFDYLTLVLAPFLAPGPFDYGAWKPHREIKRETLTHPSLWRLAPPEDLLPVLRVASGLKGLFARLGVSLDVHAMLREAIARRAEPGSRII